jgi:hypothetical protein
MLLLLEVMFLAAGCRSLFLSSESQTMSRWKKYSEVNAAFNKITPYHTTVDDLTVLGFNPPASPNVKILTYLCQQAASRGRAA